MPSNIIIFEAEYISELVASMNSACELMSEAVQSLKQASLHEGWKCKECARISENLDDLNVRLGRLDEGVNETARVLSGSVSRFTSLETSYKSQAKELSDDLTQNHGYSGTVHRETSEHGNSGRGERGAHRDGESNPGSGHNGKGPASGGRASSMASSAGGAGVIISGNGKAAAESSSLTGSGAGSGYSSASVNLPVTHIPDRPEAAAKGVKYTQEIADIAVSKVARSITEALHTGRLTGAGMSAQNLVDVYNAGKSIVENSASIMSNPAMPHTKERLAMAEGIVNLTGISMFTITGGTSGTAENFRSNAGILASAVGSVDNGSELQNVLTSFMSEDPEGISPFTVQDSSGRGGAFFDKIVGALKEYLFGDGESSSVSSSSSSNSPVDEFMRNLITEQV